MCLISGIENKQKVNLCLFILPQILVTAYLAFVLQVTSLGSQIQQFPQYFQSDDWEQENIPENDEVIPNNIFNYFDEEDIRFDKDEKDSNNFSKIAELTDANGDNKINFQKFYHEFLSYNMPVVMRKAAIDWPAFLKWQSDAYLVQKFGEKEVEIEMRGDGENKFAYFAKNFSSETMKYKEFINLYKNPERKANYYWAENNIPEEIADDIVEPEVGMFMNLESTKMWQGASGTESLPHTDDQDNFLCQISGKKTIILIPPTQRNKLYVGAGRKDIYNYSKVDFFNPNLEAFPLFANVNGKMKVEIEPGDILFIPAFWWHHVKSSKERNLAVNFWYTPNYMHQLFSMAFESGSFK